MLADYLRRKLYRPERLLAHITSTPPGWESYEGLTPLEQRLMDGDR